MKRLNHLTSVKASVILLFFVFLLNIDMYSQEYAIINLPWTKVIEVSNEVETEYDQYFLENKTELIFDSKIYELFGGQGGLRLSIGELDELNLTLDINLVKPDELRIGQVISLENLGYFNNRFLGTIKDDKYNYEYHFSINNNHINIEGHGLVDNIKIDFKNKIDLVNSVSYPWVYLANVNDELFELYNNEFVNFKGQLIFDEILFKKYEGEGGFIISKNDFGYFDFSLKVNLLNPISLKTGAIISLNEIGYFQNKELGVLSGDGYNYVFSILNNSLTVVGGGLVSKLHHNFTDNKPLDVENVLSYELQYPWTKLYNLNESILSDYNQLFQDYNDQLIFDEDIYNQFGGQGGFSISENNNGDLILEIKVDTIDPKELKNGVVLSLAPLGFYENDIIGHLVGNDYNYIFSIENNNLVVQGSGKISNINASINNVKKNVIDVNFPWTSIFNVNNQTRLEYESLFNKRNRQLFFDTDSLNYFAGEGGISIKKNIENNSFSISVNINVLNNLELKTGNVFSMDSFGVFEDQELGEISNENFNYKFSIKSNNFFVQGSGLFNVKILNLTFVSLNPSN